MPKISATSSDTYLPAKRVLRSQSVIERPAVLVAHSSNAKKTGKRKLQLDNIQPNSKRFGKDKQCNSNCALTASIDHHVHETIRQSSALNNWKDKIIEMQDKYIEALKLRLSNTIHFQQVEQNMRQEIKGVKTEVDRMSAMETPTNLIDLFNTSTRAIEGTNNFI